MQWDQLYRKVKADVAEISPEEAWAGIQAESPAVLDVREQDEVDQGHIEGAVHIPRGFLELRVEKLLPDKHKALVVYSASGVRSVLACASLSQLGYQDVVSVGGGFTGWKSAGLPFVVPEAKDQRMSRYMRHFRIPEVGEAGQRKLLASKVLLIGAGGLGSPSALYLTAAGVGTLGIVDSDNVDLTNLQRQILHKTRNVGMPKVASARETLYDLNPDVRVVPYFTRLTRENAEEILSGYDVVVDGCDNFQTRYLVNDICVKLGIPNMFASIFRFDGQATAFIPGQGPCYRCLYPVPPPAELAPSCEEAGVLGILPGIFGLLQATEAIKAILGIGRSLAGRLLYFDALEATFRSFKFQRDPDCPACGAGANIDELVKSFHVAASCAVSRKPS